MARTQHLLRFRLHIVNGIFILGLQGNALHMSNTHHTVLRRRQRNINHVVLVLAYAALSLAFQHADNLKGSLVDTHNLAYRVAVRKKAVGYGLADYGYSAAAGQILLI